jgi:hypothetical protein
MISAPKWSSEPREKEALRRNAISRQLNDAVNKAVASAEIAYDFNAGSYTAQVLSDVLIIRKVLKRLGLVEAAE